VDVNFGQKFYFMEMSSKNPLYVKDPWLMDSVYRETHRKYKIDVQVCQTTETCHPRIDSYEQCSLTNIVGRTVIFKKFDESKCLSKLSFKSRQANVRFNLSIFDESNPDDQIFELQKTITLQTTIVGNETLHISGDFCGSENSYLAVTFFDRTPPFLACQSELNEIQLSTPVRRNFYSEGDLIEFFSSPSMGKLPVDVCWRSKQIIGTYYPDQTDDDYLVGYYRQRDDHRLLLSVFPSPATAVEDTTQIEFSAKIAQPGNVTFMLVSEVDPVKCEYKIESTWSFYASSPGNQVFKVPMEVDLEEGLFLAVAAKRDVLLYDIMMMNGQDEMCNAFIDVNDLFSGSTIDGSNLDFKPAVGMRIEFP